MIEKKSDVTLPIAGGCFCRAIRYEISSPPIKSAVCHCHACQHLTGGSSWAFIIVPRESVVVSGEVVEFAREGSSGQSASLGFCCRCGTTLYGKPELWPDIMTISVSTLDDKTNFSPDMHVWVEAAQPWVQFDSDTPRFPQNP